MPSKFEARAKTLDMLYEKHVSGALSWAKREGEDSYQTSIGEFSVHIDKKTATNPPYYIVWIFFDGEVRDRIDTDDDLGDLRPSSGFSNFGDMIGSIYQSLEDGNIMDALEGLIENLKALD